MLISFVERMRFIECNHLPSTIANCTINRIQEQSYGGNAAEASHQAARTTKHQAPKQGHTHFHNNMIDLLARAASTRVLVRSAIWWFC